MVGVWICTILEVGIHVGLVVAAMSDHVINYPKKATTQTKRSCQLTQKMGHSILFSFMQWGRHFHGSKASSSSSRQPQVKANFMGPPFTNIWIKSTCLLWISIQPPSTLSTREGFSNFRITYFRQGKEHILTIIKYTYEISKSCPLSLFRLLQPCNAMPKHAINETKTMFTFTFCFNIFFF